jgi:hypothetical protein
VITVLGGSDGSTHTLAELDKEMLKFVGIVVLLVGLANLRKGEASALPTMPAACS